MKKLFLALSAMVLVASLAGCGKQNPMAPESGQNVTHGTVTVNGVPQANVSIMVITSDGRDLYTTTKEDGSYEISCVGAVRCSIVAAAAPGMFGMVDGATSQTDIRLESVTVPKQGAAPSAVSGEMWFGVYATDSHGDVTFRYQGNFRRYFCSSPLPWIFGQNPDPNSWDSGNVTFASPWKGKKLLVPTRLRWYHGAVYGYSISSALYLVSSS